MRWSFPIRSGQQNLFDLRLLQISFPSIMNFMCFLFVLMKWAMHTDEKSLVVWIWSCHIIRPCLFGIVRTHEPTSMMGWDVIEFFLAQAGTRKSANNSMQTVLIVENLRIRCMAIKDPSKLLWPAAKKCQCTTVGLLCLCFHPDANICWTAVKGRIALHKTIFTQ